MKVICDRAALQNALNLVAAVAPARSPKPELSCLKLSARKAGAKGAAGGGVLSFAATDAEVSLRLSRTQVEVHEPGDVLIPADRIKGVVQAEDAEPTLTLETEGDSLQIRGRDAKFRIFGQPVQNLPPIPEFPDADSAAEVFAINAGTLQRLITRTIFSVARDNSRYAINGVLMKRDKKKVEMVATDGRRLALARGTLDNAADKGAQCIIPTKALSLVSRLITDEESTVRIAITANQVLFAFDADDPDTALGNVLASNLVEGTFPPYEDVIPKDQDKRAKFDVGVLSSAVRRAALLTTEDSRGIRMQFAAGDKTVKLTSRTPEMGEAEIDIPFEEYEGGDIEIGFNPAFLSDALKIVPDQAVLLELKAPNKPGLIRSGSDFMYVVMPVNLH
ncbi:MAG: DNA polymerase III subunit beta [Planctomycetota bacterium]|nr:DNA polymerase III subunit beta [Planctomycetota bacterium]